MIQMTKITIAQETRDLTGQSISSLAILTEKPSGLVSATKQSIATRPAVLEIGSNGARLMLPNGESLRYSIRLASYVFNSKNEKSRRPITKDGKEQLHTVIALALQRCRAMCATHLCCVATSALREAPNRVAIQREIKEKTGVAIQCISGELEAQLIANAISALAPKNKTFYAIDVGGGSIEVIACKDRKITFKVSAALGSVTLKDLTAAEVLKRINERMVVPLQAKIASFFDQKSVPHLAFVTGGNPQDLIRMATHKKSESILLPVLKQYLQKLLKFSKNKLKSSELKPDRIDVIKNASLALMEILDALHIKKVIAPNAGLRSGVYRTVFGDLPFGLAMQTGARLQAELAVLQSSYALVNAHCLLVRKAMLQILGKKISKHNFHAFRPAALVSAAAALHDIGHSIIATGKHAQRGAQFVATIGITSLSKKENIVLSWLIENHNNATVVSPPPLARLSDHEARMAIKILTALRQAERMQHEHVL